jgi:hypothetical protein
MTHAAFSPLGRVDDLGASRRLSAEDTSTKAAGLVHPHVDTEPVEPDRRQGRRLRLIGGIDADRGRNRRLPTEGGWM